MNNSNLLIILGLFLYLLGEYPDILLKIFQLLDHGRINFPLLPSCLPQLIHHNCADLIAISHFFHDNLKDIIRLKRNNESIFTDPPSLNFFFVFIEPGVQFLGFGKLIFGCLG